MASGNRPGRRSLSEKLRGMRFMQQSAESELREKLAAQQEAREKAAHWTLEGADGENDTFPIVVIEEGLSDNPMLGQTGRQSFGNFNLALQNRKKSPEGKTEVKKDVKLEKKEEVKAIGAEKKPSVSNAVFTFNSSRRDGKGKGDRSRLKGGISKRDHKPLHYRQNHKNSKYPIHEGYLKGRRNNR